MASTPLITTQFLIIGAGPSGASLSAFLSSYSLRGLTISASRGPARTPRAHFTFSSTLDILRTLDLHPSALQIGKPVSQIPVFRWCETLAGTEYARLWSLGTKPSRAGDYAVASPCEGLDIPQGSMENMLVRKATDNGWTVRYDTKLVGFERHGESGKYICLLEDLVSGGRWRVATEYLFGADGARSVVVRELGLTFEGRPQSEGGLSFNVLVRLGGGMEKAVMYRAAGLHIAIRLEGSWPFVCLARKVEPGDEWMFSMIPKGPEGANLERSNEDWKEVVRDLVGDEGVEVEILRVSSWWINERAAEKISKGKVFCIGDAVHQHPPTNALGSNTAIQEAFNLAWKVHLVSTGRASPELLETYNAERQPYGADVVKVANATLRKESRTWDLLGVKPNASDNEDQLAGIRELKQTSEASKARRMALKQSMMKMETETHQLGREIGHIYSSSAVYALDEPGPFQRTGKEAENPVAYYEPCTYPGRRVPHIWLNKQNLNRPTSTIDLAAKGRFCLFVGHGGQPWREAAELLSTKLQLPIVVISIGMGLEWEDPYLDWYEKRGVDDDGAVLVRPDLVVAWRAPQLVGNTGACAKKLEQVLRYILHLPSQHES